MGGAAFSFTQDIWCGETRLVDARTRVACLGSEDLRPRPIPKDLFKDWRNE